MRSSKRWAKLTAVAAATTLALSACGGGDTKTKETTSTGEATSSSTEGAAPSGQINLGVAYETTNYDPSTTSSALAMGTNWHVVEGLYEFDMTNYKVFPALAAGEPKKVSDTEYEITLRDGAKFSDGTDVTTKDFLESYKRTTADTSIYKQFFTFIDSVEAKDDKTVVVKLKYPFAALTERLVDVKVVPASSDQKQMTAKPVGTGPFKYETISNTAVEAVPNEFYNGSKPAKVTKMHWDVLKDDSARLSAALGGTIDVMETVPSATKAQLEAAGWTLDEVPGYNNPFLMFNTTKAPFDNKEVRKAFHYAIDREKLVKEAMGGDATVATSFLPKANPMYKEAAEQFTTDTAKAKAAFEAAGLKEITLITTDHPWIANLAPQIRKDLEAAGLTVNVQSMASGDLYSNFADVDNATFDVALAPGDPSVFGADPGIIINWWYGDNVWTKKRAAWGKTNPEGFKKLTEIVSAAEQATGDEAKAKWGEAQDLIADEAPIFPLFHRTMITGINGAKVVGGHGIGTTGLNFVGASAK
ncbi:ABC transporter substrate-binding protein [Trueperella pecoris]|uniref:ABC transporter substrate-binding protein n=1 Tax=Trueperella pecoris TaxID=2733571 RepID=A0A7M1QX53_9ACTO|nr:ABC transporter substrate-binding protein [Trueperella pecoris]QOQ39274.1 ABC transporter substrate-binding protein [Trueperella pecoris]QOR46084.1 ABC transporter substrate-binding protein [Trueperella pecoris]